MLVTAESACHSGYDGYKKKKGCKVHLAVDTLGHLLALTVTPANQGDRTQVQTLCQQVQEVTGDNIQLAYVIKATVEMTPRKWLRNMACNSKS